MLLDLTFLNVERPRPPIINGRFLPVYRTAFKQPSIYLEPKKFEFLIKEFEVRAKTVEEKFYIVQNSSGPFGFPEVSERTKIEEKEKTYFINFNVEGNLYPKVFYSHMTDISCLWDCESFHSIYGKRIIFEIKQMLNDSEFYPEIFHFGIGYTLNLRKNENKSQKLVKSKPFLRKRPLGVLDDHLNEIQDNRMIGE